VIHPALPLFVAAAAQPLLRPSWRGPAALTGAVAALVSVLALGDGSVLDARVLGFDLNLVRADALSGVFASVFAVMACLGTLFALHVRGAGEQAASLVYAGSAIGVTLAGDWVTLFAFWEAMAVSSAVVVWSGGRPASAAAGRRYFYVHFVSGSLLFAGIVLLAGGGQPAIGPVPAGPAFWLVLLGVGINAAIPPLHAWLTDAYPEASVTGSVFLSAFTTKAAVYVLIRTFPGADVLIGAGVVMALYGVVFAVLENDIRRLLAYHIVSQVGYMVAGVGMGTALALDGAAAHAFCHILYKSLLFMGAGAVIAATGCHRLTELGGLAPRMKLVFALYMVGAFSISGFPLWNGFVSKSMVVSAAAEGGWPGTELLLTLASVGTFLHTGLKLPWFTFFGPRRELPVRPLPRNMLLAMAAAAVLCTGLGVLPGWLYARLPFGAAYEPWSADHVVSALQLLAGTGLAFALLVHKLGGEPTISLDTDRLYRAPLVRLIGATLAAQRAVAVRSQQGGRRLVDGLAALLERAAARPGTPPVGSGVLWVLVAIGLLGWLIG
jgi:multicomponent Na+:H+ antiporter subunit D